MSRRMRSERIVACLLVVGIAGAMSIGPRTAQAQTPLLAYTVHSVNQYANLTGADERCSKQTIPRATASSDEYVYCFYVVLNDVWYEQYQTCLAPMGFYETRKYDIVTGDLIVSRDVTMLDYVVIALTVTNNGSLWGVHAPSKLVEINTYDLTRARLVMVNIPGYGISLYDVTADPADQTNSLYVCGRARAEGTEDWQSFAAKIDSLTGNVVWWVVYPDGEKVSKMAVDGATVACLNQTGDDQNVLFHDAASGSVVSVSSSLGMQANDIDVCESSGCGIVAGCIENGPYGGTDACVGAVDVISGKINSLVVATEADEELTGGKVYGRLHVKGKILVHGCSVSYGETQSTCGLIVECEMGFDGTIKLLDAVHLGGEGLDVAFYDATYGLLGGGGQYGVLCVAGTVSGGSFGGGEYHGADTESFVAILTPDPVVLIEALIARVESMNLHQGIENSLDVKLENAVKSLESLNAGNRQDAVNKLDAFINECVAQSGHKLTPEQADELIEYTVEIIVVLQE